MGITHCRYIRDRLYNFNKTGKPDPSMNKSFLAEMRKQCPEYGHSDSPLSLNPESGPSYSSYYPNYKFTNTYYSRVLKGKSVLGVDQQLKFGNDTNQITKEFAKDHEDFRKSFALSISRMGGLKVLTGTKGEIRRNCRCTNKK